MLFALDGDKNRENILSLARFDIKSIFGIRCQITEGNFLAIKFFCLIE